MTLETRKANLQDALTEAPAPIPRLHPRLADLYSAKVDDLRAALTQDETCLEASQAIRNLIDEIRLVPLDGALTIELYGELAALFQIANENPRRNPTGAQITLVAGARYQRYLDLDTAIL